MIQPFFYVIYGTNRQISLRMNVFERYFSKNQVAVFPDFPENTAVVVIIPVFDDFDIFGTIDSLCRCIRPEEPVGVILVVNHPEYIPDDVKERNRQLTVLLREYLRQICSGNICFHLIEAYDMPAKSAGVGLARKIAMDCAAAHFYKNSRPDGVISSLDADTLVMENYLTELLRFFRAYPVSGVAIAYEHRREGLSLEMGNAIAKYELYLRYYRLALAFAGHPYSYHCIGSAFAVRAADYAAQGGMNKRQAGEDFYFLQKLISTGRFANLRTTKVYPSSRVSERTPFGTGRMVKQITDQGGVYLTYHFGAFLALKPFFRQIGDLYKADEQQTDAFIKQQAAALAAFAESINLAVTIKEVNANCASVGQFRKRFFDNFNAFQVLKYLNFVHSGYFPKQDIRMVVDHLLRESGQAGPVDSTLEELLDFLRHLDEKV